MNAGPLSETRISGNPCVANILWSAFVVAGATHQWPCFDLVVGRRLFPHKRHLSCTLSSSSLHRVATHHLSDLSNPSAPSEVLWIGPSHVQSNYECVTLSLEFLPVCPWAKLCHLVLVLGQVLLVAAAKALHNSGWRWGVVIRDQLDINIWQGFLRRLLRSHETSNELVGFSSTST